MRKRNIPVARVIPIRRKQPNRTQLGCGPGSVEILSDLTEPMIPSTCYSPVSCAEVACAQERGSCLEFLILANSSQN